MNDKNPLNVGIGEKATNNPPIELLVENEATLNFLSKSLPSGTVAYTRGREKQWQYNGSAWLEIVKPSGLPAVSGDDNGKVLTVVEGEWAPAAGGGGGSGGGNLVVHDNNGTLDKTWKEIYDAFVEGKYISKIYEEESLDGTETYQDTIQMCIITKSGEYVVSTRNNYYSTDSETGYPGTEGGGGNW